MRMRQGPLNAGLDIWQYERCGNESNGHRSCTIINLGKIALELGRSLQFDPVKQLFINDEEANRLIDPHMRAPFSM